MGKVTIARLLDQVHLFIQQTLKPCVDCGLGMEIPVLAILPLINSEGVVACEAVVVWYPLAISGFRSLSPLESGMHGYITEKIELCPGDDCLMLEGTVR